MKVLLINGSPHQKGNTAVALDHVARRLNGHGIETETIWIGNTPVRGCIACYGCYKTGRCIFSDELYDKARAAVETCDGLIMGSPTYYAGPNGSLCALLDRLFYSSSRFLAGKPGAAVAIARRGGASTTFERLNKYFEICNMPVVPSNYWNIVYGREQGEAALDKEGMQTMEVLADNMAWMLKAFQAVPHPEYPAKIAYNFIRPEEEK